MAQLDKLLAHIAQLKEEVAALKELYAVLDVWENEPDIDRELLTLADYATPHIAGYSHEAFYKMAKVLLGKLGI